ncbi:hypothetical protein K0M31_001521 [Melipona bicolor]|uniref:Uncharacterized protein n=1 Tax=Melipona bicolor TaxID=60889 RepID=A0AA40GFP4_9HYME|nr:hypothetical protein K0M31_001521 [Melipona bicolor]
MFALLIGHCSRCSNGSSSGGGGDGLSGNCGRERRVSRNTVLLSSLLSVTHAANRREVLRALEGEQPEASEGLAGECAPENPRRMEKRRWEAFPVGKLIRNSIIAGSGQQEAFNVALPRLSSSPLIVGKSIQKLTKRSKDSAIMQRFVFHTFAKQ